MQQKTEGWTKNLVFEVNSHLECEPLFLYQKKETFSPPIGGEKDSKKSSNLAKQKFGKEGSTEPVMAMSDCRAASGSGREDPELLSHRG
jgi:hypothetical protein